MAVCVVRTIRSGDGAGKATGGLRDQPGPDASNFYESSPFRAAFNSGKARKIHRRILCATTREPGDLPTVPGIKPTPCEGEVPLVASTEVVVATLSKNGICRSRECAYVLRRRCAGLVSASPFGLVAPDRAALRLFSCLSAVCGPLSLGAA
ncbi:hypothetical protein GCM10007920_27190 [Ciceribacter naphthalenivorans]|uniref:Uncharacterized protein n=1 Tax=Sphingomonas psychrolutea TaxID=1259676 RepID=A0ABQ6EE40_9SPHN|nr:hypothetical protein GCM10007920_27190 [Ciceribacter naphthalenivorans]GLT05787.1 hypothetical protein GCM10007926_27190 [Sphingomonas psychrolutea]